MGSFEIVFYQPPGQFLIEFGDFNGEISQVDEFFLNSPVKSLIIKQLFCCTNLYG